MSQDVTIPDEADRPLHERDMHPDPMEQFRAWYGEALAADLIEPTAMTLATATPNGRPSARVVLLKHVDDEGLVFFTNYDSRKGCELAANPHAALELYWPPLYRQVRIEGLVEKLDDRASDAYHRSRDRGRQLSAWISRQSRVVERADLERDHRELEARYAGREIPRPPFWGGYLLRPRSLEFWQGRRDRLHDRLRYRRDDSSGWVLERLAP